MPIAGRISDVVGRRRTFVAAYVAVHRRHDRHPAPLVARPVPGRPRADRDRRRGDGAGRPRRRRRRLPRAQPGPALGMLGAIETLGWVWGPLYGAMLVRFLSWEWQFWLNVPLALLGLAAHVVGARRSRPAAAASRGIDWVGAILVDGHAGLAEPRAARQRGDPERHRPRRADRRRRAPTSRWLYAVALAAAPAFVWHQRRTERSADRRRAVPRPQRAARAARQLRRRRRARDRDGRRAAVRQRGRGRPRTLSARRRLGAVGADRVDGRRVVRRRPADRAHVVRTAGRRRSGRWPPSRSSRWDSRGTATPRTC